MQTLDLKVQFNYHIELREDRHYYSVPWRLKGTRVQVLYNDRMVEIYHDHLRVAAHQRDADRWRLHHRCRPYAAAAPLLR